MTNKPRLGLYYKAGSIPVHCSASSSCPFPSSLWFPNTAVKNWRRNFSKGARNLSILMRRIAALSLVSCSAVLFRARLRAHQKAPPCTRGDRPSPPLLKIRKKCSSMRITCWTRPRSVRHHAASRCLIHSLRTVCDSISKLIDCMIIVGCYNACRDLLIGNFSPISTPEHRENWRAKSAWGGAISPWNLLPLWRLEILQGIMLKLLESWTLRQGKVYCRLTCWYNISNDICTRGWWGL